MSPRPPAAVTDAELQLLQWLWRLQRASIRELTERLYPGGGRSHYATVQVLLNRLERKGLVRRQRDGRAHVFEPLVARGELVRRRLADLAQVLCGGAIAPLLSQLLPAERLTPEEAETLQRILDRLDREE